MCSSNIRSYPKVGTTQAILIPKKRVIENIRSADSYFLVKIHSAQAAFCGKFWEKVQNLVVTSDVKIDLLPFTGKPIRAIHCIQEIKPGQAESLGIATNLINVTPAIVDQVYISIEFLVDKKNLLYPLMGLINDGAFFSTISIAPSVAAVATFVGSLAQKVIETFMDAQARQPILKFEGDFNIIDEVSSTSSLSGNILSDAYYVILGTSDKNAPLPSPSSTFEIKGQELLVDGQRVTNLSYVILDITKIPSRKKELGREASWYKKLSEAEVIAEDIGSDIFADDSSCNEAYNKCRQLIKEANLLLRQDPLYLLKDVRAICAQTYAYVKEQIFPQNLASLSAPPMIDVEISSELDISSEKELREVIERYQKDISISESILKDMEGII